MPWCEHTTRNYYSGLYTAEGKCLIHKT